MGQETEIRRYGGFGDTNYAARGPRDDGGDNTPLPEAMFSLDVQGETERAWRVQHFTVTEALSTPYEAVLDVASETFTDNPDAMLGRYALLQVQRDVVLRRFYGLVRRVEQRGTTGTSRLARVFLVPALWTLSQRSDTRIFQHMTAVEIVQSVLQSAGLYLGMLQLQVVRERPRREYCVQHRETDLAFVSRLLESEGITYFFRHENDGTEVLVLTDGPHAWLPLPTMDGGAVPIAGPESNTHRVEAVRNLTWHREQRPTGVEVRDFDFTRPGFTIGAVAPKRVDPRRALYEPASGLTIGQYEGAMYTRDDADDQAEMRLEAELAPGATGEGQGLVTGMMPGLTFAVTLAGAYIPEQQYLVTRVVHEGDAQEELVLASEREALGTDRYFNRFVCALAEAPQRPPRVTPRPTIAGVETATVVGPVNEEVFTDEHGRIKVQFHWDRAGARNERSSCWIRATQGPWSGGGWGFQFLPRVGMEVAVGFVEGDPDHPVVLGALFNGRNVPPYELPANRTRSGIRTQTVGGEGHNELSFEDAAGAEQVRVHAQRDLDAHVRRDHTTHVGRDHATVVARDIRVEGSHDAAVAVTDAVSLRADRLDVATAHDHVVTVGRDRRETVERSRFDAVNASLHQRVDGDHVAQVAGYVTSFVGRDRDLTVQGDDLEAVWGDRRVAVQGDLQERLAGDAARYVDGVATIEGRGEVRVRAGTRLRLQCGQSVIEMTRDEVVIRSPTVRVEADELFTAGTADARLALDGADATLSATGDATVAGDEVTVTAKNARATLGDDGVAVRAKASATIEGKGASLTLDGTAALKGTQVKLDSGAAQSTFRSRIGAQGMGADVHVLATQLMSPGGVPLADERVEVVDAQTDEVLGAPLRTNERGELRVEVPHPGPWDIRLLHDDHEEPAQADDHDAGVELHAQIVDHRGVGLEGLRVTVRGATNAEMITDADGVVNLDVEPGPYTLEVAETDAFAAREFYAHATRTADRTHRSEQSYVFVMEPDDPEVSEDLRAHRSAAHDIELDEEAV